MNWKPRKEAEKVAVSQTPAVVAPNANAAKPARRPLPEHLPRDTRKYPPEAGTACPDCGGEVGNILATTYRKCWSTCQRISK